MPRKDGHPAPWRGAEHPLASSSSSRWPTGPTRGRRDVWHLRHHRLYLWV